MMRSKGISRIAGEVDPGAVPELPRHCADSVSRVCEWTQVDRNTLIWCYHFEKSVILHIIRSFHGMDKRMSGPWRSRRQPLAPDMYEIFRKWRMMFVYR